MGDNTQNTLHPESYRSLSFCTALANQTHKLMQVNASSANQDIIQLAFHFATAQICIDFNPAQMCTHLSFDHTLALTYDGLH